MQRRKKKQEDCWAQLWCEPQRFRVNGSWQILMLITVLSVLKSTILWAGLLWSSFSLCTPVHKKLISFFCLYDSRGWTLYLHLNPDNNLGKVYCHGSFVNRKECSDGCVWTNFVLCCLRRSTAWRPGKARHTHCMAFLNCMELEVNPEELNTQRWLNFELWYGRESRGTLMRSWVSGQVDGSNAAISAICQYREGKRQQASYHLFPQCP